MEIGKRYSHLNGWEYLQVHKPCLWKEVEEVIAGVDAEKCRTKISKEKRHRGKLLYAPGDMNKVFKEGFTQLGWEKQRHKSFYTTDDEKIIREIISLPPDEQRKHIEKSGKEAIRSSNQIDFVKDGVAVEVQFGAHATVGYDLFVKHVAFYVANEINVGVEILPMSAMSSKRMAAAVSNYEVALFNIIRQGRTIPPVPLIVIGILP